MAHIRPVTAADEAQWRGLWRDYLTFYQTEKPDAVYQATFARLLSPDPAEFRGLVAEENGRLVGLVHYLFLRTNWSVQNACYLQDLYADPAVRGSGIGRALIEAVYAAADRAGIGAVYWFTADDNQTARQLYDRIAVKTPFVRYRRP
jgi:GNAT superfamily N-acetyltransferase